MKYLTLEDVLDYQIGSTSLSTGGGGVVPSLEEVRVIVQKVLDEGHKLKFIDLKEVPNDEIVRARMTRSSRARSVQTHEH
ncbi:MAG: hypothetical protein ABSA11_12845 [Candidatus Bathyarchaeia archaeon]|jgi:DUF917 family protein